MITRKRFRGQVQRILRKTCLLAPAERLRYYLKVLLLHRRNRRFVRENGDFVLPPSHLAFDAYSSSHWEFYKLSGEVTAKFLKGITEKYFGKDQRPSTIYEWGCGPARITRQLPFVFDRRVQLFASDYNAETIAWCKNNIPGVHFYQNELLPPLPYADGHFAFIFGVSVFTHLSEHSCTAWANELYRVLRPGGILLITTDSDSVYQKELLADERKKYDETGIVVRAQYQEGKKMFLTRHSPAYIRQNLLKRFEVLEHVPAGFPFMKQDYWIARKK